MKLKTLKDFDWGSYDHDFDREELRQEAIKWIKDYRDNPEEGEHHYWEAKGIINWIKHFFNIKEEDLKEVKDEI